MIYWLRRLREKLREGRSPEIWRDWYEWVGEKISLLQETAENPGNEELRKDAQHFLTTWFQLVTEKATTGPE